MLNFQILKENAVKYSKYLMCKGKANYEGC